MNSIMARKLRIQYPGAIYHVMNRGDRREDIFEDDKDRERFLETLTESCEKTAWQIQAYRLKQNGMRTWRASFSGWGGVGVLAESSLARNCSRRLRNFPVRATFR